MTEQSPQEQSPQEQSPQEQSPQLPQELSTPARGLRWISVMETLVFIAVVLGCNFAFYPQDRGLIGLYPHPFWAIVLLISVRYGFKESVLSAACAAAAYSFFVFFPAQGTFHFSALSLFTDFRDPILFLLVAGAVSGHTQHLVEFTAILRARLLDSEREVNAGRDRNQALNQALRRLEGRIAGEFTSILDLSQELAKTKGLPASEVKRSLLDVLADYLKAERATYYDVERGRLTRLFSLGEDTEQNQHRDPAEDIVLTEALRGGEVAHLGHFVQQNDFQNYAGVSLLAGALHNAAGETTGLVAIEQLPFIEYNPHTFKLFATILEWWSASIEETEYLEDLRARSVFNAELGLYNYTYFNSRLSQEFERARRFSLPMSLSLLRIERFEEIDDRRRNEVLHTLAQIISGEISALEMAACYHRADTIALSFPIVLADDAEEKVQRIIASIVAYDLHPYQDAAVALSLSWSIADYQIGMESERDLIAQLEQSVHGPDEVS